jgi:hypothetical protein
LSAYDNGCVATRIGRGGDHHRVVHTSSCYNIGAANAPATEVEAARADNQHTIEDFVPAKLALKIRRSCGLVIQTTTALTVGSRCHQVISGAWRSLTDLERRRAAKLMEQTRRKFSGREPTIERTP